jgi:GGDEF domain-containing protein
LRIRIPSPKGFIEIGCTVGIAVCPADASDPEGLLALADRLMYLGKKTGRHRLVTIGELEGEAKRA